MDRAKASRQDAEPGRNRLAQEKSPYLRQHADNPVHWWPWSEQAFEEARRTDRPVFLSIGYSTCHWCHVMAHESFEDPDVARRLNDAFVNVKVDREERPDVDATYMAVCQMMTGSGGWPLTLLLTPDREPFFAATYIPKTSRFGRRGLLDLIPAVHDAWTRRRSELETAAKEIRDHLRHAATARPGPVPGPAQVVDAFDALARGFDAEHGGFGGAPKFPSPHTLLFLLGVARHRDEPTAGTMILKTLSAMAHGGIHDHLGGGFHRYAVDARWHLPHFEKMLYDQALHALAYAEAARQFDRSDLAATARSTLDYALRDLRHPEGGFYASEDADSEGEEGRFYLWRHPEILDVLGATDGARFAKVYDVRPEGNFVDEATRHATGHNVLHRVLNPDAAARLFDLEPDATEASLADARRRLLAARDRRPRPHRDEKVLTDWNGLMLAALARTGRLLDEPRYVQAAQRLVGFIDRHLRRDDGRLWHRWCDGEAAVPGLLDDYAFLQWGFLELHQATLDPAPLDAAVALAGPMMEGFRDASAGGFWSTDHREETVLVRRKDHTDGAAPSGNSVALHNLVRLGRLTGRPEWDEEAERLLAGAGESVRRSPTAFTHLLAGSDAAHAPSVDVVVAGDRDDAATHRLLATAQAHSPPDATLLWRPATGDHPAAAPYAHAMTARDGRPAAYVCHHHACQDPTTDPEVLKTQLEEAARTGGNAAH